MNRDEHLLTIIGEECAEVHQRCSKALRFGIDEIQPNQPLNNKERILQEFNDLVATMELFFGKPIEELISTSEILAKQEKIQKYLNYSKECGTLTDDNAFLNKLSKVASLLVKNVDVKYTSSELLEKWDEIRK